MMMRRPIRALAALFASSLVQQGCVRFVHASAAAQPSLASRIRGAFMGAVVGDALCLGSHYEYDANKILAAYGGKPIEKYMAPGEHMGGMTHGVGWGQRNYHPGKTAGEQTDYGDYNALVLEYFATRKYKDNDPPLPINKSELISFWQRKMETWVGWKCTQTRQTLQQIQQGVPQDQLGGMSNAMAIRHAAAFAVYSDEKALIDASTTVMFTHRNSHAFLAGPYLSRVVHRLLYKNMGLREAIESAMNDQGTDEFIRSKVKMALSKVDEAADPSKPLSQEKMVDDLALTSMARLWDVGKSEPIKVGKASPTEGTLPGAIYFILKYQQLLPALQANAMVGGDNASRSIAVGMVLGAYEGVEAIPESYRTSLKHWQRYSDWLDQMPLLKKGSGKDEL
ncbi:unnamed protein product [Vitrella brassicaformis CCMP3155]|uniref:ADP-ribosylhydrolase ARH3 n=2 Tax=Vitrella brassicaformis TaxID=1169539 RepID=A0A0G4EX67_VITBC|nr:unnamed protein product [Vitrella brassicaformis CCMP3155]|eukprot:CEM03271.1 unnamed protein product [Vitrella brassicaformis CCMP3155]